MAKEKRENKNYDFSSTDLLIYIWEKRVPLLIITFIAGVASIFISFMITPKFRSSVVLFPTTSTSISKNLLADNYSGHTSMYEIGDESQAEQILQILNSEKIKDRIIEKYNLMEHYEIDPSSQYPITQLNAEYKSNINFNLTEYLSIVIDVLDKDPQMAADIANNIASLIDTVYNDMLKQRAIDAFHLVAAEKQMLEDELELLQDSISQIRALGVNHYETQAERYYEAYAAAIREGNVEAQQILEEKLNTLSIYGGQYVLLRDQLNYIVSRLSRMEQRYEEAQLEAEQNLPHKFIVDSAFKAEKKAYPNKSLIVIIST